jgi:filamentous hemagglutinin
LSEVAGEWSPTLDRLGLLSLGAGTVGSSGLRPRPAGTPLTVGASQVEKAVEYFAGVRAAGPKGMPSIVEPKIAQQMGKRGWTTDSLEGVIANPSKTVVTKDTRFDPISGTRLNDPATGYVAKDGSYVVRNDRTGAIVQVSDKNDKNWVAPWD